MSEEESFVILGSTPTPSMDYSSMISNHDYTTDQSTSDHKDADNLNGTPLFLMDNKENTTSVLNQMNLSCSQYTENFSWLHTDAVDHDIQKKSFEKTNTMKHDSITVTPNISFSGETPMFNKRNDNLVDFPHTVISENDKHENFMQTSTQTEDSFNINPHESVDKKNSLTMSQINKPIDDFAFKFLMGNASEDDVIEVMHREMHSITSNVLSLFPSLASGKVTQSDCLKIRQMLFEYNQLKDNLLNTNKTMRQLFAVIEKWQQDINLFKEQQHIKQGKLLETIKNLQEENQKLEEISNQTKMKLEEESLSWKQLESQLFERNETIQSFVSEIETLKAGAVKAKHCSLNASEKINESKLQFEETAKKLDEIIEERNSLRNQLNQLQRKMIVYNQENVTIKLQFEEVTRKLNETVEEQKTLQFLVNEQNNLDNNCKYDKPTISSEEHNKIVKELNQKIATLTTRSVDYDFMKKNFMDENNCLRVNLTSMEELLKKTTNDLAVKQTQNLDYSKQIEALKEEILVLRAQTEIYAKDFESERTARQALAGEKDQILGDLKLLQRRNQQLIEDAQIRLGNNRGSPTPTDMGFINIGTSTKRHTPDSQVYHRLTYMCPICHKDFKELGSLQVHVQECMDKSG